jgi:hypothetical protein
MTNGSTTINMDAADTAGAILAIRLQAAIDNSRSRGIPVFTSPGIAAAIRRVAATKAAGDHPRA